MASSRSYFLGGLIAWAINPGNAFAQRAMENAITSADDAFGTAIGSDSIGIYDSSSIRGFSPVAAGNLRIEGLYFDQKAQMPSAIQSSYSVRVGVSAQAYIFPAPTGIVDYSLRRGTAQTLSTIATLNPNMSPQLELDSQIPLLNGQLALGLGGSVARNHFANGGNGRRESFGILPNWRVNDSLEITSFFGREYIIDETAPPIYLTKTSSILPPLIKRGQYPGPFWATSNIINDNSGILGLVNISDWTIRAGAFYSATHSRSSYANLFYDTTPDGFGDHVIVSDPPQRAASTSGELRMSRAFKTPKIQQSILLSFRWRNAADHYGGSAAYDAGIQNVNDQLLISKPIFAFNQQSELHIFQQTIGVAYELHWNKFISLSAGIQHADYSTKSSSPSTPVTNFQTSPWMHNFALSFNVGSHIVAYGSYARGLEDSGNAPDGAANRGQPLPVLRSRQYDFGLKWSPNTRTNFIAGYFDIKKPYVTANSDDIYGLMGNEIHRGIEISLTTSPVEGLTVVIGGVYGDPTIDKLGSTNEVIGSSPVGQPKGLAQLNVDFDLPFLPKVSVNASVNYMGGYPATTDNRTYIPPTTLVNVGGRYRFSVRRWPCSARLLVSNAVDHYGWISAGSGAYQPLDHTGVTLSLTTDF